MQKPSHVAVAPDDRLSQRNLIRLPVATTGSRLDAERFPCLQLNHRRGGHHDLFRASRVHDESAGQSVPSPRDSPRGEFRSVRTVDHRCWLQDLILPAKTIAATELPGPTGILNELEA